ncbi:Trypsin-like [Frankliniella occidentalis]|uniref:Trypsin delta-like n=1 Tax=Frankliniella occidentalis TaxID=133901 RepID=A0A6J1S196_FRAOC|nr:trypsin delta-like [Frankliniella occidentalis]KAE8741968.1 Trypsin-like [Frankliniella occidentalis]
MAGEAVAAMQRLGVKVHGRRAPSAFSGALPGALIYALLWSNARAGNHATASSTAGQQPQGFVMPHKVQQIVGGTAADIRDFGHQVSWLYEGFHRCGGSILTADYILTAAHCVSGSSPGPQHEILAGTSIISTERRNRGQTTQIVEMHVHPKFDVHTYTHDIALLRVWPQLSFNSAVHPIQLIDAGGAPYPTESVVVTGWGLLKENSQYQTPILQKVRVFVNDIAHCRNKYMEASWVLPDTLMCAAADKKDACQGDSGGPLVYYTEEGSQRLVGIVSSGIGCASKDFAGLYTDLRHPEMRAYVNEITGYRLAS